MKKLCNFYKVQIRPDGTPVVSTMMGFDNAVIDDPCVQALVPNYQMSCPAGTVQCFPSTGLRYFYLVDPAVNSAGVATNGIVPNSMWSRVGKPSSMCKGSYTVLEFVVCS